MGLGGPWGRLDDFGKAGLTLDGLWEGQRTLEKALWA